MRLRHSVRGLLVDADQRLLLYYFHIADGTRIWAAPGGGIEAGESRLEALRRELREETGYALLAEPTHVWHQEVEDPTVFPGFDGIVNDYYLIRTAVFTPQGTMSEAELASENIRGFHWWSPEEIQTHTGPDLFSPRELAALLPPLLAAPPPSPLLLGF